MKLSEIQQNVITNMLGMEIEPGEMIVWINDAMNDLAPSAKLKKSVDFTLEADKATYTLPDNFMAPVYAQKGGKNTPFIGIQEGCAGVAIWGSTITVKPTPDKPDTLTLFYHAFPAKVATDTDVIEIPDQFHRAIVFYTTAQAKRKYMMMADAEVFDNLYFQAKGELTLYAVNQPSVAQIRIE